MSSYNIIIEALLWELGTGIFIYPYISTNLKYRSFQTDDFADNFDEDGLRPFDFN